MKGRKKLIVLECRCYYMLFVQVEEQHQQAQSFHLIIS